MRLATTIGAAILVWMATMSAHASALVSAENWTAYKARFLESSGRIVDDGNGGISHSEGQGYGLLLAFMAGDPATFQSIWSFTRTELLIRDDGLAAWKWDPAASPHVRDINNATDGDILIAYALAQAGAAWSEPQLTADATRIVKAIGMAGLWEHQGRTLIAPATAGFSAGEQKDGPVVNLSYWIFEAFPIFATLDPATDWNKVGGDGLAVLASAAFGPNKLPPDWLSLARQPKPAAGFTPEFGYNALRIPLYLARAGLARPSLTDAYLEPQRFAITDLATGRAKDALEDPGYRIIPALVACMNGGSLVSEDLKRFAPTLYFPSTLHLLALAHLAAHQGECR